MTGPKIRQVDYYPDEFLIGVAGMTPEQIGVYWVICSLMYSSGGPISVYDERISRICGASKRKCRRIIEELMSAGKLQSDGQSLANKRANFELSKAINRVNNAQTAGKKGGRPKEKHMKRA